MKGKAKKVYTKNESVEMMLRFGSTCLEGVAKVAVSGKMSVDELVGYLTDTAEQLKAQSLVVSLRDECGILPCKEEE